MRSCPERQAASSGEHLRRRGLLLGLAAAALAPRVVRAQAAVPRVGIVSGGPRSREGVVQGLRDLGYVPGQTVIVEHRQTDGLQENYAPRSSPCSVPA